MHRDGPRLSDYTLSQLATSVNKSRRVAFQSLSAVDAINGDYVYSASIIVGDMARGVLEVLVETNRVLATVPLWGIFCLIYIFGSLS